MHALIGGVFTTLTPQFECFKVVEEKVQMTRKFISKCVGTDSLESGTPRKPTMAEFPRVHPRGTVSLEP